MDRGPHNLVHLYVGGSADGVDGTMAEDTSPNDPIFWLHQPNIDRLWAAWESRWGHQYAPLSAGQPGHNRFDELLPFGTTPASLLDYHARSAIATTTRTKMRRGS